MKLLMECGAMQVKLVSPVLLIVRHAVVLYRMNVRVVDRLRVHFILMLHPALA